MLNLIKKTLAIEIDGFLSYLKQQGKSVISFSGFTSSAYVQSRNKIKPEVFTKLSSILVSEFYTDNDASIKLWKGFRLLAVDGSTMNLPSTEQTQQIYGYARNQTGDTSVQGRVSVIYDVLNKFVIDGILAPRSNNERGLALQHLNHTKNKDLIIYDRGYYSYEFIKEHLQKNIDFLFRAKRDLNVVKSFIKSKKKTQIITITLGRTLSKKEKGVVDITPISIRLVRVNLPSGEIEVLATSLLDSNKYPNREFKTLYFKRWNVETFYDELKNKLKAEHFTGYSNRAIQQDFNTMLLISNIQSLIVNELEDQIIAETQNKKWNYKVNSNLSYGFLKDRILEILFSKKIKDQENKIEEIKKLFKKNLVPIRPNRSNPRNKSKRTSKKHQVTKNQRDAI